MSAVGAGGYRRLISSISPDALRLFGRPYILKVDGCIHDGWLVISQTKEVFDQDYLLQLILQTIPTSIYYFLVCSR